MLREQASHLTTLAGLLRKANWVGRRVHDAKIAAICLDHGIIELWSADRDFSAFPALKIVNLLID